VKSDEVMAVSQGINFGRGALHFVVETLFCWTLSSNQAALAMGPE